MSFESSENDAPSEESAEVHYDLPASDARATIRELLNMLPPDVVQELNQREVSLDDPAFLDGLMDHVSRSATADPQKGRALLGKLMRLKKQIAKELRKEEPQVRSDITVRNTKAHVGRNDPCPCHSGKKFKKCCGKR